MKQERPLARQWMRWLPLLLLSLCLLSLSLPGAAAPLIRVDADFTAVDLADYADLLADTSQQLTIEAVTSEPVVNNFSPTNRTEFHRANRGSAYWLRFGIDNSGNETQIVIVDLRAPGNVGVLAYDNLHQPLNTHRAPLLQLFVPAKTKQLYYLRIEPGGLPAAQLSLLSLPNYIATYRAHSWLNSLMQGAVLLIAGTALIVGLLRRERSYGWLFGYCLALIGFLIVFHDSSELFSAAPAAYTHYRNKLLRILLLIASIGGVGLAVRLPIAYAPRRYGLRALIALMVTAICAMPLALMLDDINGTRLTMSIMAASTIATIAVAISNFLQCHRRELLLYALARMPFLILVIVGTFIWATNGSVRDLTDGIMPTTLLIEVSALLAILLWRSFEYQTEQARSERDIAILEAEARSRTEIVAGLAHRIRTPISGVLGMLDMLHDTSLSSKQLDYLRTIKRASSELLETINEISDISRLHSHSTALPQSMFDPYALFSTCIDGFRSTASAHALELITDVAPEVPACVWGDSTRLRQIVLQSLHIVVSQYRGGDMVLRLSTPQRDWLRIQLSTRALFVPAPEAEHDATSINTRLAITRQLVVELGGHIDIEHWADGNMQLSVDLEFPVVERNTPPAPADAMLQNKRLLIIDDNVTFCEVLERQLRHWGMQVFIAHNFQEGLARLRNQLTVSQPVDILLIDADMPDAVHEDWAQRLHHDIQPLPIIILLSSEADRESLAQGLDSRHKLLKPINHANLKITLIDEFKRREQRPVPHQRTEPIRCLFAEDNHLNAEVLSSMLDRLGVIHTATTNGQQAVDACRRGNFDIVLLDWNMPVMDGWEASRHIRDIFDLRGKAPIPIIILTANTVEELGERARQSVTDAHLVKPIQLRELRELLEHWTGKTTTPVDTIAN